MAPVEGKRDGRRRPLSCERKNHFGIPGRNRGDVKAERRLHVEKSLDSLIIMVFGG